MGRIWCRLVQGVLRERLQGAVEKMKTSEERSDRIVRGFWRAKKEVAVRVSDASVAEFWGLPIDVLLKICINDRLFIFIYF